MKNKKTLQLAMLAMFSAIIILMSFTFLGYLKLAIVQITFLTIPVAVGAIILGPVSGLILGAIFGVTSFIQCLMGDPFGATLLAINPIFTFIMCLVPRMMVGYIGGLLFKILKSKNTELAIGVASVSVPVLNTILFITFLMVLFSQSDYIVELIEVLGGGNLVVFFVAFVGVNGLVEAIACSALSIIISNLLYKFNAKLFKSYVD